MPRSLTFDANALKVSHDQIGPSSRTQASIVVFVVDDEPVISTTLVTILKESGFQAQHFLGPSAASEAAKTDCPNRLITDVMMPEMTGIELAIRFKRTCPGCKVLLLSGQAKTANLVGDARGYRYDFELLTKPVRPADLLAKLRA